jgi:hypothetical protein
MAPFTGAFFSFLAFFDRDRAIALRLAAYVDLHGQTRRMRIFAGVGQKLGRNRPCMEGVTGSMVALQE